MTIEEEFSNVIREAAEDYNGRSRAANLFEDYILPALKNAGLEIVRRGDTQQPELF